MTDSLAPEVVEPLLRGRFGRPYLYGETRRALEGGPEGAVAVADEAGAASIVCSVVLAPPRERQVAELPLVAAMAAADAVEEALSLAAQIKWPGDVMVNRRKVARAVTDAGDGVVNAVIRIDVNQTAAELPRDARPPAGSLRTTDGRQHARAPILATLLSRLELHHDRWREQGLDAVYDFLGARDFLRGRRVSVDGVSGTAVRIDRAGRLLVAVGGTEHAVEAGEVDYER